MSWALFEKDCDANLKGPRETLFPCAIKRLGMRLYWGRGAVALCPSSGFYPICQFVDLCVLGAVYTVHWDQH